MQCWKPKIDKSKYGKTKVIQGSSGLNCISYLILSTGIPYYQEGWNIDYLTQSKVLIDNPWEDPERKPLRTNIEILEWSSLDLMDQVGPSKQGFGVLWPEQRLVFSRTGLTGLVWQSQRLVFEWWVFIPLGPLLRGLLVPCILLSFLRHFLDQLALPNTLCELF